MRVLIAPDKFKGTLTATQAAAAIARGWRAARPRDSLQLLPISDGGDGFGAVMSQLLEARMRRIRTVDAGHQSCTAHWWFNAKTLTALIESANVIGLAMLPQGKFHPFELDTFGLGKVLRAAQRAQARKIIFGIGGSATNDAGFGLARALGWEFRDRSGQTINSWTRLETLAHVVQPALKPSAKIVVATDVLNPLLGARGATRVYGPQKGIGEADVALAEGCLRRLTLVLKRQLGRDLARVPGAGAAGGLGFGLMAFADAELRSGFELVASASALNLRLRQADLVITGEGSIDRTTAMGKGCGELANRCQVHQVPIIGLAGKVVRASATSRMFDSLAGLTDLTTPAEAMRAPARWLARLAQRTAANLICKPALRR